MPPDVERIAKVTIRPGTKILGSLRHLNYRAWFALAEFVDNALQSFLSNRERLAEAGCTQLRVDIEIQGGRPGKISLRDNAAGIAAADFVRAFRPAEVPPDATGLSEFGMGMKSAACWFAQRWSVRSSSLGEGVERTVRFDIAGILAHEVDELDVETSSAPSNSHFTEVVLDDLHQSVAGRTLGKVKEHLRDIYRCYLRDGTMELRVAGEVLSWTKPEVLVAPYYRTPDAAPVVWEKSIDWDLGGGQTVKGFAALRKVGRNAEAGFAMFRRNRLIQGSADEGWKPIEVFGSSNSYRHQRLFGELHLTGFDVSHTKDGFRFEDEAEFAALLAQELDKGDKPLLKQGEGYRQNAARPVLQRNAEAAVQGTSNDMRSHLAEALPPAADNAASPATSNEIQVPLTTERLASQEFSFEFRGSPWTVVVRISDDDGHGDWLVVRDVELGSGQEGGRRLEIEVSAKHPFMTRFAHRDEEVMQALTRVAAAMGIAEAILRSVNAANPSALRRTTNELLRDVFSST
jgi:hypothetical protein